MTHPPQARYRSINFSEGRLARVLLLLGHINEESKAECAPEGEPSNPGGDGWYHPHKGKSFYEWVQEEGLSPLQRRLANK